MEVLASACIVAGTGTTVMRYWHQQKIGGGIGNGGTDGATDGV